LLTAFLVYYFGIVSSQEAAQAAEETCDAVSAQVARSNGVLASLQAEYTDLTTLQRARYVDYEQRRLPVEPHLL
jgi:hypothetical protein